MASVANKPANLVAGMKKGSVPRELREQQLIDVAENVFSAMGYQSTSLEEVARQAGVTRQFLYKVFGGKEQLYVACHSRARGQLRDMLIAAGQGLEEGDSVENLHSVVRACNAAYFEFVEQHGDGWDVLFGSGAAVAGPAANDVMRLRFETVALLAALIQRGAPDADPQLVEGFAHAASGAGNQLAIWWRKNPQISRETVIDINTAFMWTGIEALTNDS